MYPPFDSFFIYATISGCGIYFHKSWPVRFLRDGELLSREDTAVDVGLEDGDQIDGFLAPACIHCPHCSNRI